MKFFIFIVKDTKLL